MQTVKRMATNLGRAKATRIDCILKYISHSWLKKTSSGMFVLKLPPTITVEERGRSHIDSRLQSTESHSDKSKNSNAQTEHANVNA